MKAMAAEEEVDSADAGGGFHICELGLIWTKITPNCQDG
uniref:Abhydrolase domain containing 5 n=1 Tax=Mus musculus TaxID=10090 RepID=H3BKV1_MOUSE